MFILTLSVSRGGHVYLNPFLFPEVAMLYLNPFCFQRWPCYILTLSVSGDGYVYLNPFCFQRWPCYILTLSVSRGGHVIS